MNTPLRFAHLCLLLALILVPLQAMALVPGPILPNPPPPTPTPALVPGPILFSDDQVSELQADAERKMILPTTRSRAACLTLAQVRLCPGQPIESTEALRQSLPADVRSRVVLFAEEGLVKGILALSPAPIQLPPAQLGDEPVLLGPEPQSFTAVTAAWPNPPVQQTLDATFLLPASLRRPDIQVWYEAYKHLGLVTHRSQKGEFVIGVFVVR
jgi:hypothetical protein